MARESRWSEEGLDLHVGQEGDGTWAAALVDATGKTLWSRGGYKDQKNAQTGASAWIRKTYGAHAPQKPQPRKPAPSGSPMVVMLRRKAEENLKEVVRLRTQADLMEEEAKRLDMAADVLAGPEEPEEGADDH